MLADRCVFSVSFPVANDQRAGVCFATTMSASTYGVPAIDARTSSRVAFRPVVDVAPKRVTDRDVVIRVVNKGLDPAKCPVADIMSLELVTLNQGTGLYEALEQIKESGNSVRRFPIVDDHGAIKGIITLDDVIYLLGREMSDVAEIIESERPRL